MSNETYDTALTAAYDQSLAEIRDLRQMIREHRKIGVCNGRCPGLKVVAELARKPHLTWLDLLLVALMRIDELEGDPQIATAPPDPEAWL